MRHFCTLFDRNYAARGLALHRSLMRHAGDFTLHVLCLDEPTREALSALRLPRIALTDIEALGTWDPDLREARKNRTPLEFYFTCKPVLLAHLLARLPQAARVDYLDADLGFFADPAALDRECAGSAVALTPHRFGERHAEQRQYGRFNAGWLSVGANTEGHRFIAWWRARCLEWCRLVVEESRFGDQKYLDQVPNLFPSAVQVSHPGANLAPWNIDGHRIALTPRGVDIEGQPLVFFHFHGVKRMLLGVHESGLHEYGVKLTPETRSGIYRPYIKDLVACRRQIAGLPGTLRACLDGERVVPNARGLARQLVSTARAVARRTTVLAVA
jgi:hypothetical protein